MNSVNDALVQLRAKAQLCAGSLRERKATALAQLQEQQQLQGIGQAAGHTPSGPRRKNEGVEDEDQGIVAAEPLPSGGARLRITLLAAGFLIGPSGSSIRDLSSKTGADIRSFTESWWDPSSAGAGRPRKVRTVVVEGKRRAVVHALEVISAAVDRYSELTGGHYCNQAVDRTQIICGISFMYSPPPRAAVPYAAALRGQHRPDSPVGGPPARKSLGFGPAGSPLSATNRKENLGSTCTSTSAGYRHLGLLAPQDQGQVATRALQALPATPMAMHSHQPAAPAGGSRLPALARLRAASDEDELMAEAAVAPTPNYTSAAVAATAAASSEYTLFGGTSLFSSVQAAAPALGAPASVFSSAFEPSPSVSMGSAFSTPCITPGLMRESSGAEDALLAASGFPTWGAFPQRPAFAPPISQALVLPPQPAPWPPAGMQGQAPLGMISPWW